MTFICWEGHDFPDVGNAEVPCCHGSAMDGPAGCTCWRPAYDLDQADTVTAAPGLRSTPCGDCAYRAGSPERQGAGHVAGDADALARLVVENRPFFCHQGVRRPTHYVHPSGATYTPEHLDAAYDPPIRGGVPYRADGTPADLCAGWAAARLQEGRR